MSIKSTQRITRKQALELLRGEIEDMSNDMLASLLDKITDSGNSKRLSYFDNFIVSDFIGEELD